MQVIMFKYESFDIFSTPESAYVCKVAGVKYVSNTLAWDQPGVGQHFIYFFLEAVVYMFLTIMFEVFHFNYEFCSLPLEG